MVKRDLVFTVDFMGMGIFFPELIFIGTKNILPFYMSAEFFEDTTAGDFRVHVIEVSAGEVYICFPMFLFKK